MIRNIPYLNTAEGTKYFVKDVVQSKYTEEFTAKTFSIVSDADIQKTLSAADYDVSNME